MNNNERQHVAIVGGGLAGLATAAYLARAGHRVSLFERSESAGGRAATVEQHGYLHNLGPHALYRSGAGLEVLTELGVQYSGGSPDLSGVAVRRGKTFTLPVGGRSLMTSRLFGMRSRVEAGSHLMALRKDVTDHRTVAAYLREDFKQAGAREYVEAFIRLATYANAPEVTSVRDAARQLAGSGGVLYLDGGWQTLIESLASIATASG
ncbi:MAG: FAD-dependent oxidoreductase, partial [bacterium]